MAPRHAPLTLAEELLLLALDDDRGVDRTQHADEGLAAALLLELAAGGWLESAGGPFVPTDQPAPDGALGAALDVIRGEDRPHDGKHWLRKLPGALRPIMGAVAQPLVERGVLGDERRKVLGLVPVQTYPERDPAPERELRERLRAELTGTREPSERTALLAPLLLALDLVNKVVERDERKAARAKAEQLAERPDLHGVPVRQAVKDLQVGLYVALGTAVGASLGSAGSN
jgi:hypothetical protein